MGVVLHTEEDIANEREVAEQLMTAWGCTIHSFGVMNPIDWYAQRDERLIGLLELKSRTHTFGTYPTVFLAVRKWIALTLGQNGLGVPGLFVVRFLDGVRWVPINEVDGTQHRVAGRLPRKGSVHDIEPVIDVPVEQMRPLTMPAQQEAA